MDATVLLTGATGYIGGRLLRRLEEGGRAVRCLARQPGAARARRRRPPKSCAGDCLDEASLDRALAGVQSRLLPGAFDGARIATSPTSIGAPPRTSAAPPRAPACARIIYLGGLTDDEHRRSRPI